MPPADERNFLTQVFHVDEPFVTPQMALVERPYGGQPYAVAVADFVDPRAAALLWAWREDEMWQILHRARLLLLEPQPTLGGPPQIRLGVRLILHTNHPVPGLRVDDLRLRSAPIGKNDRRQQEAEERIRAAVADLTARGGRLTVSAVARAARAHKKTVSRVLGNMVHTSQEDLLKPARIENAMVSASSGHLPNSDLVGNNSVDTQVLDQVAIASASTRSCRSREGATAGVDPDHAGLRWRGVRSNRVRGAGVVQDAPLGVGI